MWSVQPYFEAKPVASSNGGWGSPQAYHEQPKPIWHSDIELKKAYGARLGKGDRPLDAALLVFNNVMCDALWAVQNWIRDPIVVETRETVENNINLLDKDQLSAKLLKFADEKTSAGNPIHESKDRLAALKLYAEIQGFVGKVNIDASQKTFINNAMEIVLVEADQQQTETKIINHVSESLEHENALQIDLQLVG